MKLVLGLLVVFEIMDGIITHFLIKYDFARESNSFLEPMVGQANFLVLKIIGVLLAAFILWDIHKRFPKVAFIVALCFVVFYGGLVLWNASLFFPGIFMAAK